MNQTTTNLPNRTDLQSCNSLSFGKRMTLPLSGRSLRRGLLSVLGLMAVIEGGISSVQAAGTTNTNSATNSFNWTNGASWTGGLYPGSTNWTLTNNTSLAFFTNLVSQTLTLNDNLNLQSITFGTNSSNNTVSGSGTLFLTTGGTILNNSTNAGATNTIANNIAFVGGAGTYTFNSGNNNNGNGLAINGAITSSNTGTTTMLLGGAGSNLKIVIGGNITDTASNMINLIAGGGGNSPSTSTGQTTTNSGLYFTGNNIFNSLQVGANQQASVVAIFTGSNNVRTPVNVLQGLSANSSSLVVSGANGYLIATNGINVGINGMLVYDNGATSVTNRFGNSTVTLNGGRFITTATNTNSSSLATVTQINLGANYTSYLTNSGAATGANTLTIGSISAGSNATLQTSLGGATNNGGRVIVTSAPTLTAGILPWAVDTVSGAFLTYSNSGANNFLGGYGSVSNNVYLTNATAAWDASSNVAITASTTTNTGNNSVNSLSFKNSAAGTLTLGGANTLTVASGGILSASNVASGITGGFITAGSGVATNLYLWNLGTSTQSIGSGIVDNGSGVITLNKSGSGITALTGTNTYSGDTYIQQGTLSLASGGVLGNGNYAGQVILNGGTLNFASGTNQTISGNVNGTNGGTLLVNGGVLTLSGSSNSFAAITNGTVTSATGLSQLNIAGTGTTTSSGNIGVGYSNAPSATNMLTVASGATLNAQANLSVGGNTGLNKLSNAGTINMTNGAATQYLQFGTGGSGTYTFDTTGSLSITGSGDRRFQMSAGATNATTIANFLSGSTSTISYFIVGGSGQSNNNTATIYTNAVVNVTSTNNVLAYSGISNSVNTLTISGGLFSGSTFTMGLSANSTNNLNTLNLGSGTISLSGTLGTGSGNNSTNVFNWTGGTLSAGTIVATNGGSGWAAGNTASSISNNTLFNTNAGTLLVGNSTNGYAGKTIITGSYNQNGSATTTFNILGTVQATQWTGTTNNYSYLSVATNASIAGGKVVLNFGSFVPTSGNTFNLLAATAANGLSVANISSLLGGANSYANASGSNVSFAGDGLTYVALTTNGTTLTGTAALNQWKGGNGNWTATNFSGGVAPNSTSLAGYFTNAGGTVTLTNNVAVNSLTLSNATGYALAGGSSTLTLSKGNGTGVTLTSSAGSNSIAPAVAMGGTMTVAGNGALSLNGNLSDGGAGYALLDSNSSTVNLAGSNSYSGGTLVSSGTLGFGTANSFGSGAVTNNGTLSYTGSGAANLTNAVTGTGSLLVNGAGTLALGGSQSFSGVTIQAGGLTVAGNQLTNNAVTVSGGNLAVSSSVGNVTLNSGSANITGTAGAVTVSGGALSGTGTLGNTTLNVGSTVNVSNGTAAGTLNVGSLTINGGTFAWNLYGTTSDLINAGAVTFANSPYTIAVNNAAGNNWDYTISTNYTILTGTAYNGFNATNFTINSGNAGVNGKWALSSSTSAGLVLVYTANNGSITVTSDAGLTTLQSVATNTVFADSGSPTPVVMNGAGEYVLDMPNTYSGSTTIGSGTLTAQNNSSFGSSQTIYLGTATNGGSNATVNINTAGVSVGATVTAQGSGTNSIVNTSGDQVAYTGGVNLTTNATVANTAGGNLVLSSSAITGAGTLTVSPGSGTVTLAAANTYIGGTTLNGGTLALSNSTALGSGTLSVAASAKEQALTSVNLANNVAVATGGNTLTLDANGNALTNSGSISGSDATLKVASSTGAGTVTLSGANTYGGATVVNNGTLALGRANALPSTTALTVQGTAILNLNGNNGTVATLADGGSSSSLITNSGSTSTLTVNGSSASSFGGVISGALGLTKSGTGTLTLNGVNTYSAGTTISGGTLQLGNALALGSGALTDNGTLDLGGYSLSYGAIGGNGVISNSTGASVLTFTNAGASTFAGSLRDGTGTLSLVKNGNGTLTLTGASTMAGGSVVNAGTLLLTNGGSLANSALTITNVGYQSFTISNAASTNVLWVSSTAGLSVGQNIAGNGISNNVTITAITDANHITISANTTTNGANTAATVGAYNSIGVVQSYGSTLTNVTVAGNGNSYGNATSGSAGSVNFFASNTTIGGTLTVQGPATGMSYVMANVPSGSIGANFGYAQLSTGVTLTNLVLNGRLDILGSGSMSLSNISSTGNGNTYYPGAGGGSGALNIASTYNTANSAGGYGNILNFVGGSVFGGVQQVTNSYATFTESGTGTVSFASINGSGNSNSLYTFSGGNWFFSQIGQANSSQQAGGTNILVNGANLTVGTNNSAQNGGIWVVGNGTMTFQTNAGTSSSLKTQGQTFGLVVSNAGTLNILGNYTDGGGVVTNTTYFMTNNGGKVTINGNVTVGTAGNTNNTFNFVTTNGGVTKVGGNLTVGTAGSATTVNDANTVTLGGGSLAVVGTFGAGTNVGETDSFNWTGGTLSAGTVTTTNAAWTGANSAISNSTLYNTNGILAPGTVGVAGKTTITGNYVQGANGTLAIDAFGISQGTAFTNAGAYYDTVAVSKSATVGGTVTFNGFVPSGNSTLTILSSTNLTSTALFGGANAYNGLAFNSDGFSYWTLGTNATSLQALYNTNNINQWQGGTGTWDATTTNWTAGVNPNATNLTAYFGTNGAGGTITVSGNKTNAGLLLSNNSTGYTLNGPGSLTLGNGASANLTSYGSNVVNPNIALNGQLNLGGTGTLTLGGNISGNYGLYDSNAGTVYLSGSNSYTGTTTVDSGTLVAATTNSLSGYQSAGCIIITNNGTLTVTLGDNNWSTTAFNTLVANATIASGALGLDSSAGGGTVGNNFSGNFSLAISGTGTITLTGDNSGLSNGITLVGGTLVAGSQNALGNGSSPLNLAGSGNSTLDLQGQSVNLSAVNLASTSTQNLTLTNGTLVINPANNALFSSLNEASNASVNNGANYMFLGGNGLASTSILGGSNIAAGIIVGGAANITLNNNYALGGGLLLGGSATLTTTTGFTNASATLLDISGASGGVTVASSMDFGAATLNAGSTLTVSPNVTLILTNGVTGGMLTKSGSGTLILGGNNTSSGTALNGGTIYALGANSLGANLALSSGLLDLGGNADTFTTVAFNGTNYTVTNGSFSVTSGYTASNTTVSQDLGGAATFTANGGTVFLTSTNNSYTGGTFVTNGATLYSTFNAGTTYTATNARSTFVAGAAIDTNWTGARVASVVLDSGTTLAVDATGTNFLLNASLTNGANATLGTYGTGTVTLADPNNSYSAISALSVTSGTLAIGSSSLTLTNLTLSGGTLDLGSQTLTFGNAPTLIAGALQNGTLTITNAATFSSNLVLTNNASLNFSTNVTFTGNTTETLAGTGTTTVNGYLYQSNSGNTLTVSGSTLNAQRIYLGTTNTQSGNNLIITNGAYVSVTNGVYGLSVNAANSQVQIGGSNGSSNSTLNLNNGRVNLNNGDSLVVNQGGVATNAQLYLYANSTATVTNGGVYYAYGTDYVGRGGTNSTLSIGSTNGITSVFNGGYATYGMTVGGGASNSINNSMVVNQGGLVTNMGFLFVGGYVTNDINNSFNQLLVTNGGAFRINGTMTNYVGYATNDNSNSIVVTGAGSILSQGGSMIVGNTNYGTNTGNNVQVLNGGVLSNSGIAITLDNNNSYMTISGGTVYTKSIVLNNSTTLLTLTNNGAVIALASGNLISGSGTVSLAGNGTISAGSYSVTNNTVITGPGTLTVNGGGATGTLTMAVSNSYTGGTIISSGTLAVTNLNVLGSGSITDNGTLALSLSGTSQNVSQNLAGTGGLSVIGAGTLTLSGTNTYLGTTLVTNSTVNYQTSGSMASNSGLTVNNGGNIYFTNSGTINYLNAFTNAVRTNNGSITLNAGSSMTISNGATLTYSDAANNLNGNRINVNGGTLTVDNGGSITTTNLVGSRISIGAGGLITVLNGGYIDMGVYSATIGSSAGTNILTNAVGGIVKMGGLYMGYPYGSGTQTGLNELLNSGFISNNNTLNMGNDKSNSLATNIVQNYGTGTITGGGNVTIGTAASASNLFNNAGYVSAGALTVGNNSNSAINVLTNTGTFIASGTSYMGSGGSTNNTIYNNGVLTVNANFTVGNSAGTAAVNTVTNDSSGNMTVTGALIVGNGGANGNNTVTNAGTLTVNQIQLGGSSSGAATNILTSSGNITVTGAGSTSHNIGNGSNATGLNELILTGGVMSNSTASTAPWMNIGNSVATTGTNIFSLSGGAQYVGYASSNVAQWRQIYVGVQGSQTDILTNNGGTISNISAVVIGAGASNNNSIGYLGNGTITANANSGSGLYVGGYSTSGVSQSATNTFTIASGGVFNGNNSAIGAYSTGNNNTVDLEGGQATIGSLSIGAASASYTNASGTIVAAGNTNTLIIGSGSTLTTTQILAGAGSAEAGDSNSIVINGGTLQAGAGAKANFLDSGVAALTINGTGTINDGGQSIAVGANIGGNGDLTKAGNGTLTLSGANSYLGQTRLNSGTLMLANGGTVGAGAVNMASGTSFGYSNSVDSTLANDVNMTSGGTATIGNYGNGVLTITGTLAKQDSIGATALTLQGSSVITSSLGGLNTSDAQRNLSLTIGDLANVNLKNDNTYTGNTTIQQGAALDLGGGGSLSGTGNVAINGGTLLLGGNQLTNTVNSSANIDLNNGGISMGGANASSRTASQSFATLTLTGNSTINYIDFANLSGDSSLTFASIVMNGNSLNVFDWSGTNIYGDQSGTRIGTLTHLFNQGSLSTSDLANINFYAGNNISSQFLGNGFQNGFGEIVPVPEPGVVIAACMLLVWLLVANRGTLLALVTVRTRN